MERTIRKIIGANVKALREASGLSQIKFAILTGLSRASIVNIETGRAGYNIDLLNDILAFYNYKLEDISRDYMRIPDNLRDILAKYHKDDLGRWVTLSEKPTIAYAIKYRLLKTPFLDNPKEISEIKFFFDQIGWRFLGTSIQNALKRMPNLIIVENHPTKANTYMYSRRQ